MKGKDSPARRMLVTGILAGVGLGLAGAALSQDAGMGDTVGRRLLVSAPAIGERSLGSPEAPVVVIEYASATCPHCAQFHIRSLPQIRNAYIDTGKVLWIFREFPLDSLAMAAFMLARCVPQDDYFPTIETLFTEQRLWTGPGARQELARVMRGAGMNQETFDSCIARSDLAEGIYDIAKTAQSFGVTSTPTFFVNGHVVRGAQDFATFAALIDLELSK
jgi:protein-disulfide isomerase